MTKTDVAAQPAAQAPAPVTAPQKTAAENKKPEVKSNDVTITCQRGSDQRTIKIEARDDRTPAQSKEDFLCQVHYEKYGNSERVAWANSSKTHCEDVKSRIQSNLEDAGFKCSGQNSKTEEKVRPAIEKNKKV